MSETQTLDMDAHYRVNGYGAVAFYLAGYVTTRDEDYEWSGIEDVDETLVLAVMVGDDYKHTVDVEDLEQIDEDAFCRDCGQIGCGHNTYT